MSECKHPTVKCVVLDASLGVECTACRELLAYCWCDNHITKELWNRAAKDDPEFHKCLDEDEARCAICGDKINP